jgi:hypothetical protein
LSYFPHPSLILLQVLVRFFPPCFGGVGSAPVNCKRIRRWIEKVKQKALGITFNVINNQRSEELPRAPTEAEHVEIGGIILSAIQSSPNIMSLTEASMLTRLFLFQ